MFLQTFFSRRAVISDCDQTVAIIVAIALANQLANKEQVTRPIFRKSARAWILLTLVGCCCWNAAGRPRPASEALSGQVIDENDQPVARAEMIFTLDSGVSRTVYTDAAGRFELAGIDGLQVQMTISKPGFFRIAGRKLDLTAGATEISLVLNHETEIKEQLDVQSAPVEIDPDTTSHQESLVQHEILNIPVASSHDLQQSLRIIPQVVSDSKGILQIAGARPGQTEVLLDGFEVNDPGTGAYTIHVNVDSVRAVEIETGGYGVQYAHAGAGVLALDTQSGDDRVRFGITNFVPELNFQQGTHFGNWYPRVTFSGPIEKGKIWFSDAMTIGHTLRRVSELPGGQNIDEQWSGDNLIRIQANLSPQNILQGSFLYNELSDPALGLGPLSPFSTTVNQQSRRYFASVKDQIWVGHTLFDVGAALDVGHDNENPLGSSPYTVTPSAVSGNYFQALSQQSRRFQFLGNITTQPLRGRGTHILSAGWNAAAIDYSRQAARAPINYYSASLNSAGGQVEPPPVSTLIDVATFTGPSALSLSNTQVGGYAQDLWRPVKPVVFSIGVRADWDRLIHQQILEPRIAMNWVPLDDGRMKFTLAWGEHYQPLILALMAMGFDEQRVDQFYVPPVSGNPTDPATASGPPRMATFTTPLNGLEEPRTYNATAEWDERFFSGTFVGVSYLLRESRDGFSWEPDFSQSPPNVTFHLANNRNDRYVAGEAWVRHSFGEKAQIEVDYVRSRASANEVLDPTLTELILARQQPGPLLWDAPNRFVSSGWAPVPLWGLLASGFAEIRSGFPFSVVNEQQQLVEPPNDRRFPTYFSLNLGLEKRFQFKGHQWAARLTCVNVTGHNNPDSVVNDSNAPNFLAMSGGQHRAVSVRLRLVTKK